LTRDQRRLAAIVSADVVGYSLLMGRDDSATLAGLKAHRQELIDPKIAEYGGRIVKTTGDGLLLEFPSVVDAVRCAVDVQRGMAERNAGVPAEQRIEFRIGVNVGDIIIDGDDIFGDGVNVAARLQTLADPGGICVSKVVRDQVLDKLSFAFEDLGAQEVKNIARPVEVYRVDLGAEVPKARTPERKRWHWLVRGPWKWVTAGAFVLGVAGIFIWAQPQVRNAGAPASAPPHFSVAILPFAAPGGSPADEQFAEVLTKDLTMAIGRDRHVPVVSHSLAVTYKGRAIDARAIGRELNVRYLVEGEVRRAGDRFIVNAQLVDTGSARQLWSDHLEVESVDRAQNATGLVSRLNRRVGSALVGEEFRRAAGPLSPVASAMDITLHADAVYEKSSSVLAADAVSDMLEARKMYQKALRLDPNLVFAMNLWADSLDDQLWMDLHADHDRLVNEYDEVTNRAVGVAPDDPDAWLQRALALAWQWRWQAAVEANTKAGNLNPNVPYVFVQRSFILLYSGQANEALAWIERALALDPQYTRKALAWRCDTYLALGRYDDAIADCEISVADNDYWHKHLLLVAAYAQKGETARAEAEKLILLKEQPDLTIANLKAMRLSNNPTYLQQTETHLYAGLRKAGIPEK
jgi:class 3 adenylate cyclase/TolB-like protein